MQYHDNSLQSFRKTSEHNLPNDNKKWSNWAGFCAEWKRRNEVSFLSLLLSLLISSKTVNLTILFDFE